MIIQSGTNIGRYHILEQLGEGGMAVVYKAYDTRLENEVAIKFIRTSGLPPDALPRIQQRFRIEAKKMAQMTHPNIVKVMDYGEFEGVPFLVMPYLSGGKLKDKIGEPMLWKDAIRIIIPIADALQYAHEQGLIHRDIKPSNILITQSGQPMLSDFGVTKVFDQDETMDLTTTGFGVGTPEYMAPEMVTKKGFDYRVDIYSLGIVLYEMVTGKRPFNAETPLAVLFKQANDPLPSPVQFNNELTEIEKRILLKALAKDPENRYQSMKDFLSALEDSSSRLSTKIFMKGSPRRQENHPSNFQQGNQTENKKRPNRILIFIVGIIVISAGIYIGFDYAGKRSQIDPIIKSTFDEDELPSLPTLVSTDDFGSVRFSENFENSDISGVIPSGWSQWKVIEEEDGNKVLSVNMAGSDLYPDEYTFGNYGWKNSVLHFRMKIVACGESNSGGFVDLGKKYYMDMSCYYNQIYLNRWDNTNASTINIDVVEGKWYEFIINNSNSNFSVSINSTEILNFPSSLDYSGKFGFGTKPDSIVYYDDINVFAE